MILTFPFRPWYRTWNPAAYHHWETWTVSYEVFIFVVFIFVFDCFFKDVHWRCDKISQYSCYEQGYRLKLRWTHKTKRQQKQRTATHQTAVNTHASHNRLELFDWCTYDSLFCLDKLQRWRIYRKVHNDRSHKHRWEMLTRWFIIINSQDSMYLNDEGSKSRYSKTVCPAVIYVTFILGYSVVAVIIDFHVHIILSMYTLWFWTTASLSK